MYFDEHFLNETKKNQIFCIRNPQYSNEEIQKELKQLKLFRKGPFLINNVKIESQWNSYIKWKYLLKVLHKHKSNLEILKKKLFEF